MCRGHATVTAHGKQKHQRNTAEATAHEQPSQCLAKLCSESNWPDIGKGFHCVVPLSCKVDRCISSSAADLCRILQARDSIDIMSMSEIDCLFKSTKHVRSLILQAACCGH